MVCSYEEIIGPSCLLHRGKSNPLVSHESGGLPWLLWWMNGGSQQKTPQCEHCGVLDLRILN
jgi:hypothetical protein